MQDLLSKLPVSSAADVIVSLGCHFGWASLAAAVTGVVERACTPSNLAACFELLLRIAPSAGSATDVVLAERNLDRAPSNPELQIDQPVDLGSGSDTEENSADQVPGIPPEATVVQFLGSEVAAADASGGCVKSTDGEGSEGERADVCARIAPLLVTKISKGPPPARFSSYYAPANFCLKDVPTASAYASVVERFGADTWETATAMLIKEQIRGSFEGIPEMLSQLVGVKGKAPVQAEPRTPSSMSPGVTFLCRSLASAFVAKLLAEPSSSSRYHCGYGDDHSASFVTRSLQALHCLALEASVCDKVVAHFGAEPKTYSLDNALLPAVRRLFDWLGKAALHTPWFVSLRRVCVNALEGRVATRPAEPRGWALPATCDCTCNECRQLVEFCVHPARTVLQLRVAKPIKKHVDNSISR